MLRAANGDELPRHEWEGANEMLVDEWNDALGLASELYVNTPNFSSNRSHSVYSVDKIGTYKARPRSTVQETWKGPFKVEFVRHMFAVSLNAQAYQTKLLFEQQAPDVAYGHSPLPSHTAHPYDCILHYVLIY